MTCWNYRYAGLHIHSVLEIPEWTVFEEHKPADSADVTISLDNEPDFSNSEPSESWISPNDCQLSIPETGVYQIRNGCEIIIAPIPNASENELRLFLLGSAWSALCCQRGILALHASVVSTEKGAIAFCGSSGAGKSTLAAAMLAHGYSFVGDDLCCFDLTSGEPRVFPSAPRLKLWRDALEKLGWNTEGLVRDHFRMDKFHKGMTNIENIAIREPLLVRAVYLLEWGNSDLARLTGLNALHRLITVSTYRPACIIGTGRTGSYWEQCAQLARGIQIWELKRPREWETMAEHIALIIDHWG
jgi:tRNA A37 threonylcarbamoyladenosine biosynthesis protein TsaE